MNLTMRLLCKDDIASCCCGVKTSRDDLGDGRANRFVRESKKLGPLPYA